MSDAREDEFALLAPETAIEHTVQGSIARNRKATIDDGLPLEIEHLLANAAGRRPGHALADAVNLDVGLLAAVAPAVRRGASEDLLSRHESSPRTSAALRGFALSWGSPP